MANPLSSPESLLATAGFLLSGGRPPRTAALFQELSGARRVSTVMSWQKFLGALEYFFVLFGVPGFVIAMFVLYVYVKERHKRL